MRFTRQQLLTHAVWLLGSLLLAFFVWFIAIVQANPISQQQFLGITVQFELDEGLIITNEPRQTVRVVVRAQQSVLELLTDDDIVVTADLRGRGPGSYTVPLTATVARTANADTQPTQIFVEMDLIAAQQKPLEFNVSNPPVGYDVAETNFDVLQATVSGAAAEVQSVVVVRGEIDASDRRSGFDTDVQLRAFDIDGRRVQNVTIEPRTVRVAVGIVQRDDVQTVSVVPRLLINTLPSGYVPRDISYEPQTIIISGPEEHLRAIGDTVDSLPIDLSGRTRDFEIQVPLDLPYDDLLILSGDTTVTVRVGIVALTTALQVDHVNVEVVGQSPNVAISTINPETISVLLNGPINLIEGIEEDDLQVVLDLNGLGPGSHEIRPTILLTQGQGVIDASPLPPTVNIVLISTATPTAQPETSPIPTITPP